jgi:hypothetical protein
MVATENVVETHFMPDMPYYGAAQQFDWACSGMYLIIGVFSHV